MEDGKCSIFKNAKPRFFKRGKQLAKEKVTYSYSVTWVVSTVTYSYSATWVVSTVTYSYSVTQVVSTVTYSYSVTWVVSTVTYSYSVTWVVRTSQLVLTHCKMFSHYFNLIILTKNTDI